jgi:two-component system NtrC family sensor kinase
VISRSPTDIQPVLDAVAERAARLCQAEDAAVIRLGAAGCRVVAHYGLMSWPGTGEVVPLSRTTPAGRSIIDRRTVHVHDLAAVLVDYPYSQTFVERFGTRTVLAVPLLRESEPVGCITIRRQEVRPFSDTQIALLQSFADQAVIAIENVRLFAELQEKNRALTAAHAQISEALEQQTATSEILQVISRSPTDVQPVFDTIVRNAIRLCRAGYGAALVVRDDRIHLLAHETPAEVAAVVQARYPVLLDRQSLAGRAILDGVVIHVPDAEAAEDLPEGTATLSRLTGYRSYLSVPMLLKGAEPRPDGDECDSSGHRQLPHGHSARVRRHRPAREGPLRRAVLRCVAARRGAAPSRRLQQP